MRKCVVPRWRGTKRQTDADEVHIRCPWTMVLCRHLQLLPLIRGRRTRIYCSTTPPRNGKERTQVLSVFFTPSLPPYPTLTTLAPVCASLLYVLALVIPSLPMELFTYPPCASKCGNPTLLHPPSALSPPSPATRTPITPLSSLHSDHD